MPLSANAARAASRILFAPLLCTAVAAQVQWQVVSPSSPVVGQCVGWSYTNMVVHCLSSNETWRLSATNGTWSMLSPSSAGPGYRSSPAVAYDFLRGRAVLFGGTDAFGNVLGDTWEFDGTTWRRLQLANAPAARHRAGAAFDPLVDRVLVVGGDGAGLGAPPQPLVDTWLFDGTQWTQAPVPPGPIGPVTLAVRTQGVIVALAPNGTFERSAGPWLARNTVNRPPTRDDASMTYDVLRDRVVLSGGTVGGVSLGDVWEYDRTDWIQRQPAGAPVLARTHHALVYDAYTQTVRAFGGVARQQVGAGTTTIMLGEHLLYSAVYVASAQSFGAGCPNAIPLDCPALPWLGSTALLSLLMPSGSVSVFVLGLSDQTWGGGPLPMPLGPFGLPGCELLVSPDVLQVEVARSNKATWQLPIPNSPLLAGIRLYAQATLPSAATPAGIEVTAGLALRIGGR